MKAAVLRQADGTPEYGDFAEPEVGEGEELVELVAAGLHQLVRSRAHGRHYSSAGEYPLIPGVDAVARRSDGTLIYTGDVRSPYGTMAERIAVAKRMQCPLPDGTEHRAPQVAAGMNPGMSSWLPLQARLAEVGAGGAGGAGELGVVAIVGATGTSGLMAVQNARELGAKRVLAFGRNEAALKRARGYGASTAKLSADKDATVAAIREALDGDTPGIVLDYVWGAPAEAMFAALNSGPQAGGVDTEYVHIGALAGAEAALPSSLLRSRRIRVRGSGLGAVSRETILKMLPEYVARIADGSVDVSVEAYPLAEVTRAWTAEPADGARIVLTP